MGIDKSCATENNNIKMFRRYKENIKNLNILPLYLIIALSIRTDFKRLTEFSLNAHSEHFVHKGKQCKSKENIPKYFRMAL